VAVKLGIDIRAAREDKPVQPFERRWIRHGFETGAFQRRLVWR
jgi:hypothetical protein